MRCWGTTGGCLYLWANSLVSGSSFSSGFLLLLSPFFIFLPKFLYAFLSFFQLLVLLIVVSIFSFSSGVFWSFNSLGPFLSFWFLLTACNFVSLTSSTSSVDGLSFLSISAISEYKVYGESINVPEFISSYARVGGWDGWGTTGGWLYFLNNDVLFVSGSSFSSGSFWAINSLFPFLSFFFLLALRNLVSLFLSLSSSTSFWDGLFFLSSINKLCGDSNNLPEDVSSNDIVGGWEGWGTTGGCSYFLANNVWLTCLYFSGSSFFSGFLSLLSSLFSYLSFLLLLFFLPLLFIDLLSPLFCFSAFSGTSAICFSFSIFSSLFLSTSSLGFSSSDFVSSLNSSPVGFLPFLGSSSSGFSSSFGFSSSGFPSSFCFS